MKYLNQFLIIMAVSFLGEILNWLIPVAIPASVYGIVLLFLALCLGIVKVEQVKEVGGFLSSVLPVLFVPPVVGILENWPKIKGAVVAIFLLSLVSTLTTFLISGRVAQLLSKKEEQEDE